MGFTDASAAGGVAPTSAALAALVVSTTEQTHAFALTEEVEFHIIQLPRFTKTAAELTRRLDFCLYFLRHAAKIDTEAIPAALQQPLLLRAVEVLKMLTQTDIERERYEARRKGQLDHDAGLRAARLEGEAKAAERPCRHDSIVRTAFASTRITG